MLPLLLLAAAADVPPEPKARVAAVEPARAVVRIVRGAEIRFGDGAKYEESIVRQAIVRERDGSVRTASLIEFY